MTCFEWRARYLSASCTSADVLRCVHSLPPLFSPGLGALLEPVPHGGELLDAYLGLVAGVPLAAPPRTRNWRCLEAGSLARVCAWK